MHWAFPQLNTLPNHRKVQKAIERLRLEARTVGLLSSADLLWQWVKITSVLKRGQESCVTKHSIPMPCGSWEIKHTLPQTLMPQGTMGTWALTGCCACVQRCSMVQRGMHNIMTHEVPLLVSFYCCTASLCPSSEELILNVYE